MLGEGLTPFCAQLCCCRCWPGKPAADELQLLLGGPLQGSLLAGCSLQRRGVYRWLRKRHW